MKLWPAWHGARPWRGRIEVEQGVWGKAHRQASDFRWLAASPGLDLPGVSSALGVGAEDRPTRCLFWRRLGDGRGLAVAAYPSRAVDAAGRSGFLERRLFSWRPEAGDSIVQGMLALLSSIADLAADHDLACTPGSWLQPDFHLPVEPRVLEVSEAMLNQFFEQGRRRLVEGLGESALTAIYARFLAGHKPVVLPSARPFTASMLAALLLPLPAPEAERLSLAGWIPSSRLNLGSLADHWDLVVAHSGAPSTETSMEHSETAREWARSLIAGEPLHVEKSASRAIVQPVADITFESFEQAFEPLVIPEGAFSSVWLGRIQAFVQNRDVRWLDPIAVADHLLLDETLAPNLEVWRRELQTTQPTDVDTWQWQVKVDLLSALLVAVAPSSREAGEVRFTSGRVPALLFVAHLDSETLVDWRLKCPVDRAERWRGQSCVVRKPPRLHATIERFVDLARLSHQKSVAKP